MTRPAPALVVYRELSRVEWFLAVAQHVAEVRAHLVSPRLRAQAPPGERRAPLGGVYQGSPRLAAPGAAPGGR